MSFNYFQSIEDLALIDSDFGLIPIVSAICKELDESKSKTTVRNLVRNSRRLMILEETYLSHSNKDIFDVTIRNMTLSEKLFFDKSVPANYLGTSFTEKQILEEIQSKKFIKKFTPIHERGSYYIQKNDNVETKFQVLKELNNHILQYNTESEVKIVGAYPDDEQKKQNISNRMKLTSKLIDHILKQNLTFTVIAIEPLLRRKASLYQNKINLPLVGVLRISTDPIQYVVYLLSFYEYGGQQKKINNIHAEISDYFQTIFSKDSKLNNLLSAIHDLNTSDIEPQCYMKTMVAQPKNTIKDGKKVCVIQIFGFVKDLVLNGTFPYLPMYNLRDYIKEIGWEIWFPAAGSFAKFPLMKKRNKTGK